MPDNLTQCLIDAARKLKDADILDADLRAEIVADLEAALNRGGSPEQQLARAQLAARNAKTKVAAAAAAKRVTDARIEAKRKELASTPDELAGTFAMNRTMQRPTGASLQVGVSEAIEARALQDMGELQPLLADIVDHRYGETFGYAKTSQTGLEVEKVIHGGATKNKLAMKVAKGLRAKIDAMTDELRDQGVYVERMQDWWKQTHDVAKVAADPEGWKDFMAKALDEDEFPDPKAAVEELWDTLMTRHLSEPQANMLSLGRVFKMKTPALELEYARRFGVGSFPEQIEVTVRGLRRRIEIAREFGPSPQRGYREVQSEAAKKVQSLTSLASRNPGNKALRAAVQRQESDLRLAEEGASAAFEPSKTPVNQTMSSWATAVRTVTRGWFLGGVAAYHVTTDIPFALATVGLQGGVGRSFGDFFGTLLKGFKSGKAETRFLQDWGTGHMLLGASHGASSATRFEIGSAVTPQGSPLAARATRAAEHVDSWVQRATFAHTTRERTKAGISWATARNLAKYSEQDWTKLDPTYRALAENNGWTAALWNSLKDHADKIDPATGVFDVRKFPEGLRRVASTHLWREAHIGNANPTLFNRISLGSNSRETGFGSVMVRNGAQFLASPMSIVQNILARQVKYGSWQGNAVFGASLLMSGIMYVQLRAMVLGQGLYEWDNPEMMTKAVIASGILGPYGEAILGALGGEPGRAIPFIGIVTQPGRPLVKSLDALIDGDYQDAAFRGMQAASALVPNVWWYKAVMNRSLDVLAEAWSPDYAKYKRQQERKRQEGFFD